MNKTADRPRTGKSNPSKLEAFEAVEKKVLKKFPATRKVWIDAEPRRKIGAMLAGIRKEAGLSQRQLGEQTGWDKSFVSRLESARGSIPDLETIARYAQACNAQAGVVFGVQAKPKEMHVLDAVTLRVGAVAGDNATPFERLRDNDLKLPKSVKAV
jgi:transcriptional regulator with XRE-family HTH domain